MKTKLKFLKENWLLAFVWNIPVLFWVLFTLSYFNVELFVRIGLACVLYMMFFLNSIISWYNDYRFDELEKQIKDLQK